MEANKPSLFIVILYVLVFAIIPKTLLNLIIFLNIGTCLFTILIISYMDNRGKTNGS